jgi:dsRNA-specific ribonuclease
MSESRNLTASDKSNEDITIYVLNDKNKKITREFIEAVIKRYGLTHKVKDLGPFQEAMTHKSYLKRDALTTKQSKLQHYNMKDRELDPINNPEEAIPLQDKSYDRLEFLGDAVIHKILTEYLMERYPIQDEGFLTKLRSKIENCQSLAILSKKLGLNEYILISHLIESYDGRETQTHILEDVFEAFIGALYLDTKDVDENILSKFVLSVIEKEINIPQLLYYDNNYKDALLQYYHQQKWTDPKYFMIEQSGPDHKREFVMTVKDNEGKTIGMGKGVSKRKGEQESAKNALLYLGQLNADSDSEEEILYSDSSADESSSDEYSEVGTDESSIETDEDSEDDAESESKLGSEFDAVNNKKKK